jgi:hypothetical protein
MYSFGGAWGGSPFSTGTAEVIQNMNFVVGSRQLFIEVVAESCEHQDTACGNCVIEVTLDGQRTNRLGLECDICNDHLSQHVIAWACAFWIREPYPRNGTSLEVLVKYSKN